MTQDDNSDNDVVGACGFLVLFVIYVVQTFLSAMDTEREFTIDFLKLLW